uniref:Uncharacterized protein n=1 Tax=Rhizophora mucronata TaxID=61149 RepID=A0A2P2QPH5_RHIMU
MPVGCMMYYGCTVSQIIVGLYCKFSIESLVIYMFRMPRIYVNLLATGTLLPYIYIFFLTLSP